MPEDASRPYDLVLFGPTGFVGRLTAAHLASQVTQRLQISADGDPGYRATAVMLCQAGLCLAFDGNRLPRPLACSRRPRRGGSR